MDDIDGLLAALDTDHSLALYLVIADFYEERGEEGDARRAEVWREIHQKGRSPGKIVGYWWWAYLTDNQSHSIPGPIKRALVKKSVMGTRFADFPTRKDALLALVEVLEENPGFSL